MSPSLSGSGVVVLSHTKLDGESISIIGTMRKAIDDVLKSVDQLDPFMKDLDTWLTSLAPTKKPIRFLSYEPFQFSGFNYAGSSWGTCSIDPIGFQQVYLYYLPQIIHKYKLSYLEALLVETMFDYFRKSP